jgi:hypothetical protein
MPPGWVTSSRSTRGARAGWQGGRWGAASRLRRLPAAAEIFGLQRSGCWRVFQVWRPLSAHRDAPLSTPPHPTPPHPQGVGPDVQPLADVDVWQRYAGALPGGPRVALRHRGRRPPRARAAVQAARALRAAPALPAARCAALGCGLPLRVWALDAHLLPRRAPRPRGAGPRRGQRQRGADLRRREVGAARRGPRRQTRKPQAAVCWGDLSARSRALLACVAAPHRALPPAAAPLLAPCPSGVWARVTQINGLPLLCLLAVHILVFVVLRWAQACTLSPACSGQRPGVPGGRHAAH